MRFSILFLAVITAGSLAFAEVPPVRGVVQPSYHPVTVAPIKELPLIQEQKEDTIIASFILGFVLGFFCTAGILYVKSKPKADT